MIVTETTFLKVFNKSTEKRLKQRRYQSSLFKKMITSFGINMLNDYTTSRNTQIMDFSCYFKFELKQ